MIQIQSQDESYRYDPRVVPISLDPLRSRITETLVDEAIQGALRYTIILTLTSIRNLALSLIG